MYILLALHIKTVVSKYCIVSVKTRKSNRRVKHDISKVIDIFTRRYLESAWMKLLFPKVITPKAVNGRQFIVGFVPVPRSQK